MISTLRGRFVLRYASILSCVVFVLIWLLGTQRTIFERKRTWGALFYPDSKIGLNDSRSCVAPKLVPFDPSIMQFVYEVKPPECNSDPDWVSTGQGRLWISSAAVKKHGELKCVYTPLQRITDRETKELTSVENVQNGTALRTDFFHMSCTAKDGATYKNQHAAIKEEESVKTRSKSSDKPNGLGYNILMLGIDSLSHMSYRRKLPKTYKYFTETLEALVLNGYNIVGDGTPQALIPILTGKTELELPRTLKRLKNPAWVDVFPFVWKEYHQRGYVSAWSEDNPHIGTFTYRMVGFKDQPTDHYMRNYYVYAEPRYNKQKRFCMGARPRYKVHLDWFREFFSSYPGKRKFGFGFYSELSHSDNNPIGTVDDVLVDFLQWFKNSGHKNSTILMLMSDHGARFSKLRETVVGKLEERMPMFGFAFPPSFKQQHPELYANFKTNCERLTSPFDLYPTLRSVIDQNGTWRQDLRKRSISLFDVIPLNRTCSDADIEPHWCACLSWRSLQADAADGQKAAAAALTHINGLLTTEGRGRCASLALSRIISVNVLQHTEGFLKFKKTKDKDGFRADLTDNTNVESMVYQITLETSPGNGHFEVTLMWLVAEKKWKVRTEDISRINKYGDAAICVENSDEQLRKFCYCLKK